MDTTSNTYNNDIQSRCDGRCLAVSRPDPNGGDVIIDLLGMGGTGTAVLFTVQMLLVGYMYWRIGTGLYWKTLLVIAIAGIFGATLENFERVLFVFNRGNPLFYICSLIAEPFWITSEFGVVALNLIKIRALTSRRTYQIICAIQGLLFLGFCGFRVRIGVLRFKSATLDSPEIWNAHTPAFALLALAEGLLTIIIIVVISGQIRGEHSMSVGMATRKRLVRSSFFVLLLIDIVGVMLAVSSSFQSPALQSLMAPFLALKSASALILATDAVILKTGAIGSQGLSSNELSSVRTPHSGGPPRRGPTSFQPPSRTMIAEKPSLVELINLPNANPSSPRPALSPTRSTGFTFSSSTTLNNSYNKSGQYNNEDYGNGRMPERPTTPLTSSPGHPYAIGDPEFGVPFDGR
ncbi:hypothetical protein HK104_007633 [Borealophlyctis nickersoniae]|nr:hypothetical protein HK104_007633 [Borealophlyctis nickersoniae]